MPVVTTNTEEVAQCIVPESPTDPSDPDYIDPSSPSCLAKTVVSQQMKTQANNNDVITNALLNVQVFIGRYISDIKSAYVVLGLAVLLSFILGFVFLVIARNSLDFQLFIKTCSKCIFWTVVIAGFVLCVLLTLYLYYAADILHIEAAAEAIINQGDKVFHWGNVTFDSIVEKVIYGCIYVILDS